MRTLIITDTETTGLDPATCQAIEVAIVVWDVATASVRESYSSLIHATSNDAEAINRISVAALKTSHAPSRVWGRVEAIVSCADEPAAFVAHRADFDSGFYPAKLAAKLPWICSKTDIDWPLAPPGSSCVDMALKHGVPVVSAHRAMTDAMLVVRTLERVVELGHDLPAMLARAMRPKGTFTISDTTYDEARNVLAKEHGFRWEKPFWVRKMAIEDTVGLPFAVTQERLRGEGLALGLARIDGDDSPSRTPGMGPSRGGVHASSADATEVDMSTLVRIQVRSDRKMVMAKGATLVPVPDGEPVLLSGMSDMVGEVAWVKLDDGREVLIRREHLTVIP